MLKHDLVEGSRRAHHFGAGRYAGEFVFGPRSPNAEEDDGWLMGVVDAGGTTTSLEIIDARAIDAASVACIWLPHRVPPGHPRGLASGLTRGFLRRQGDEGICFNTTCE